MFKTTREFRAANRGTYENQRLNRGPAPVSFSKFWRGLTDVYAMCAVLCVMPQAREAMFALAAKAGFTPKKCSNLDEYWLVYYREDLAKVYPADQGLAALQGAFDAWFAKNDQSQPKDRADFLARIVAAKACERGGAFVRAHKSEDFVTVWKALKYEWQTWCLCFVPSFRAKALKVAKDNGFTAKTYNLDGKNNLDYAHFEYSLTRVQPDAAKRYLDSKDTAKRYLDSIFAPPHPVYRTKAELLAAIRPFNPCEEGLKYVESHASDRFLKIWRTCPQWDHLMWVGLCLFPKRTKRLIKGLALSGTNLMPYLAAVDAGEKPRSGWVFGGQNNVTEKAYRALCGPIDSCWYARRHPRSAEFLKAFQGMFDKKAG